MLGLRYTEGKGNMALYLVGMGILLVALAFDDLSWAVIGAIVVLGACFFDKNGELS